LEIHYPKFTFPGTFNYEQILNKFVVESSFEDVVKHLARHYPKEAKEALVPCGFRGDLRTPRRY
jgi:hypothetical protein